MAGSALAYKTGGVEMILWTAQHGSNATCAMYAFHISCICYVFLHLLHISYIVCNLIHRTYGVYRIYLMYVICIRVCCMTGMPLLCLSLFLSPSWHLPPLFLSACPPLTLLLLLPTLSSSNFSHHSLIVPLSLPPHFPLASLSF